MNWNIEIKEERVQVSLRVDHIRNTRGAKATYTVSDAIEYLMKNNIKINEVITDCVIYNYQTKQRCAGTWVFSLPPKPKPKKTQPPVEKKENVLKMTNKKTIKK
jgi:hypothetical protein